MSNGKFFIVQHTEVCHAAQEVQGVHKRKWVSYSTVVLYIGIMEVRDFLPYDITPDWLTDCLTE